MNQKVIIGIVVVIIIALGAFFLMKDKSGSDDQDTSTGATSAETQGSMEQTSLKGLLGMGKSQKCTYTTTENNATSTGTVYVSGGKFRGDFSATASGQTQASHMISDGKVSNLWMDGSNMGYKMEFDQSAQANSQQSQSVDTNKNYDFDCDNWRTDSSMFNLPSGVDFQDMSAMMNAGGSSSTSGGADTKAMQQAACAQLSEPDKSQCLSAIH